MKRRQTCGRCACLALATAGNIEDGPQWVCQHPQAVQMRQENERLITTAGRPHWCPR